MMEKKKVVHLVPLKFLAEEKYLDFKKKYEEFGIKVVVSLLPRHISDALYSRFNSAKTPLSGPDTPLLVEFFRSPSWLFLTHTQNLSEIPLVR